jgi:hypothetical protein
VDRDVPIAILLIETLRRDGAIHRWYQLRQSSAPFLMA